MAQRKKIVIASFGNDPKGHLHYKMLLLQSVHVCTPWSNSFFARFCATKCYSSSAYINVGTRGIAFARVLHGLPMPAHLIGSPNPLVSRAPQKGAEQAPGISPQPAHARSGKLECDQSFFLRQKGLASSFLGNAEA